MTYLETFADPKAGRRSPERRQGELADLLAKLEHWETCDDDACPDVGTARLYRELGGCPADRGTW